MYITHYGIHNSEQHPVGFIPKITVYEDAPIKPVSWEYYVLTIDTKKQALPDVARLNELGKEGWLLNGVLNEGATGDIAQVHYYFVRQMPL